MTRTTLDLSNSYRAVFDTMLPHATQVADPFHVVLLANDAVDECRRRVQNETLGHRGHKDDPLYRARRRLVMAAERLTDDGRERLMGLLRAGDPNHEVWFAWNAKEVVRQTYDYTDADLAGEWVDAIGRDFTDPEKPLEVRRLGRTIASGVTRSSADHYSQARQFYVLDADRAGPHRRCVRVRTVQVRAGRHPGPDGG